MKEKTSTNSNKLMLESNEVLLSNHCDIICVIYNVMVCVRVFWNTFVVLCVDIILILLIILCSTCIVGPYSSQEICSLKPTDI